MFLFWLPLWCQSLVQSTHVTAKQFSLLLLRTCLQMPSHAVLQDWFLGVSCSGVGRQHSHLAPAAVWRCPIVLSHSNIVCKSLYGHPKYGPYVPAHWSCPDCLCWGPWKKKHYLQIVALTSAFAHKMDIVQNSNLKITQFTRYARLQHELIFGFYWSCNIDTILYYAGAVTAFPVAVELTEATCIWSEMQFISYTSAFADNSKIFNLLRPSDAYMRRWSYHHWFK